MTRESSLRTYSFAAMSIYWGLSFHDKHGLGRLAMAIGMGLLAFVSMMRDEAKHQKINRMLRDD